MYATTTNLLTTLRVLVIALTGILTPVLAASAAQAEENQCAEVKVCWPK
ncbi:hypothetical protein [Jannaschia aquimarina]|uniref:Uncharacterized protein n=1 Tax=Jannaschia aquimarina TaxID=935700 RepID=A0A0D1EC03_9RHOB|nr:hypothetical protein [Jannaschia aquimarina]KIT14406.1 hypothetical protein jaqu_38800 [Jannaschia aquimarina]SNT44746.1 hypothetical protein SAMN05421775_1295 [Jannaschia aquimarina]